MPKAVYHKVHQPPFSSYVTIAYKKTTHILVCVVGKAVRYWSCPLSQNRDRIIPNQPSMPKWAQTCEQILSQVVLVPTSS